MTEITKKNNPKVSSIKIFLGFSKGWVLQNDDLIVITYHNRILYHDLTHKINICATCVYVSPITLYNLTFVQHECVVFTFFISSNKST